ncbi:hypothetical protein GF406_22645 [candidate division KSB1 bacterium]|nr:hypothetical protein [candidate division KSB1 bacterium]
MSKNTILLTLIVLFFYCSVTATLIVYPFKDTKHPDYLNMVRDYADAMIQYGRDTYGSEHSPLFAVALDRNTMKIGCFNNIPGIRNMDRTLGGANPQRNTHFYAILYELTELTGENKYADHADKAFEFFFTHCQSPLTGLMAWGEHLYWDFALEQVGGDDRKHEICGEWPFWERCYALAPKACWKFAIGQWDHQIADKQTGDFSRHARWSGHEPGKGAEFPRYAGQLILNWADAYGREENANHRRRHELVTAIERLVYRMEQNMKRTKTGYLQARTKRHHQVWPASNLELARCLWKAAPFLDIALAQRLRELALQQDIHFLQMPHRISIGGGFVQELDSETGKPTARKTPTGTRKPYTALWETVSGQNIHTSMANRCFSRFIQIKQDYPKLAEKYGKLLHATAEQYMHFMPDTSIILTPSKFASVTTLMISMFEITGNQKYLDRAHDFGNLGIQLFLNDGLPLPKATNRHAHYETITGGPGFMHVLLALHKCESNGCTKRQISKDDAQRTVN